MSTKQAFVMNRPHHPNKAPERRWHSWNVSSSQKKEKSEKSKLICEILMETPAFFPFCAKSFWLGACSPWQESMPLESFRVHPLCSCSWCNATKQVKSNSVFWEWKEVCCCWICASGQRWAFKTHDCLLISNFETPFPFCQCIAFLFSPWKIFRGLSLMNILHMWCEFTNKQKQPKNLFLISMKHSKHLSHTHDANSSKTKEII